jgi:hypothetical protein
MEPAPLVRVYPPCFTFWRAAAPPNFDNDRVLVL